MRNRQACASSQTVHLHPDTYLILASPNGGLFAGEMCAQLVAEPASTFFFAGWTGRTKTLVIDG